MTETRNCKYAKCKRPLPSTHRADAEFCNDLCRSRHKNELRRQSPSATRVNGQESGVGSRGGNLRSVQEARDAQATVKAKRDWSGAIDEQIRRTLIETSYFHADDLDPLGVPPEHCNLKGTRTASFRNRGYMEKSGAERKVSHAAANGRKAPIYRITQKGREKLSGTAGIHTAKSAPGGPGVGGVDSGGNETAGFSSNEKQGEGNSGSCHDSGALDRPGPRKSSGIPAGAPELAAEPGGTPAPPEQGNGSPEGAASAPPASGEPVARLFDDDPPSQYDPYKDAA